MSVVDLAAAKLIGTVALGKRPYAVALAKGRGFSTDQYGGTVSVDDLTTLQPVKRISAGDYPEGINTSADGNSVYVVNWFSAKIPAGDGPPRLRTFLRETL